MTSRSISAADFLTDQEIEEGRFLARIKGALREEIAERAQQHGMSQAQLADRCGMDPAQLSRALSPDCHASTRTLFRIAYALDRRWVFQLVDRTLKPATNMAAAPTMKVVSGAAGQDGQVAATTSSAGKTLAQLGGQRPQGARTVTTNLVIA